MLYFTMLYISVAMTKNFSNSLENKDELNNFHFKFIVSSIRFMLHKSMMND